MTNEQDIRELVDEQEEQVTAEASRRDFLIFRSGLNRWQKHRSNGPFLPHRRRLELYVRRPKLNRSNS